MVNRLLMALVALVVLGGCAGIAPGRPAERIVGSWEGTFNNRIDFFPNGVFIQTNPSGNRFAGTYELSEDGSTLSSESSGGSSSSAVVFDGDTLQIFGTELRRVGDVSLAERPLAELLPGTWRNSIGTTIDFFADGTWATYDLSAALIDGGRYQLGEAGSAIRFASMRQGDSERPLLLVTEELLIFDGSAIYDRVSGEPDRPFPDGLLNSAGEAAPEQIANVGAGEVREVGEFSLVLHQARRITLSVGAGTTAAGEYLAVEFSARNNGAELIAGPGAWRFAVLSAEGERLNELFQLGPALADEDAGQLPGDCAASSQAATLLPIGSGDLQPGAALRTWVLFQITPGLEAPELQLEVQVNRKPPGFSFAEPEALGSVTFRLDGATSLDPLPWDSSRGQTVDAVTIGEVSFSGATVGGPVEATAGDPCSAEMLVALTVANQGAGNASGLPPGGFILLDAQGRSYGPASTLMMRSFGNEYLLGPREERTIQLPFPASYGAREQPAALVLFDGASWHQIPLR